MSKPADPRDRVNKLFLGFFGGLILLYLAINVYDHVRYSRFTLVVKGRHTLVDAKDRPVPGLYRSGASVFRDLHTSWWFWKVPYTLDPDTQTIISFRANPTLFGKLMLSTPVREGRVAAPQVLEKNHGIPVLIQGQWSQVAENLNAWDQIEFRWGG